MCSDDQNKQEKSEYFKMEMWIFQSVPAAKMIISIAQANIFKNELLGCTKPMNQTKQYQQWNNQSFAFRSILFLVP